ncbi:hypothetical protein Kpho01_40880 [Kitasatospora phosalacinea]|uniref:Uncharacterized protein n=2 Tax=Kitasatospora phosalacinea TaxID=2065 RepID=A0A9W6PJQ7_9ACTN|nr:hypothetical protein Kpho01_40880 [Kitasatospora phosalacinea]
MVMQKAEESNGRLLQRRFAWHDSCRALTGGTVRVKSGYHYEPRLGAAIPDGYAYDPRAGVVIGPSDTMTVVRTSSGPERVVPGGPGRVVPGGPSTGPITQRRTVRVVDPAPGGAPAEAGAAPAAPVRAVTPPVTGWMRLNTVSVRHATNTGNVSVLLAGIDAQGNTSNVVVLHPGDSVDWYNITSAAIDVATGTIYPPDGGPRPGDRPRLEYQEGPGA